MLLVSISQEVPDMFACVTGNLGSGKTLYAMRLLADAVKAGRPCGTNISLTKRCPFYNKVARMDTEDDPILKYIRDAKGRPVRYKAFWHRWANKRGAVIVLDEVGRWFDCTAHANLGLDFMDYLRMGRKIGQSVYFMEQKVVNLNNRIRRLSERFVRCYNKGRSEPLYRMGLVPMRFARFERAEYDDEMMLPQNLVGYGYETWTEAQEMFTWFDTKELVGNFSWMSPEVISEGVPC